jgi:two-component system, OmpR family, KDP operon response regulator KdpE
MKTVLVVEHDCAMRSFICRILSAQYKVVAIEGVKPIDEEMVAHQPDLVILDRVEACQTIRQQRRDILIMMLSARANEKQIVQALDLGADGYVTKPFCPEEFAARIRALLRRGPTMLPKEQEPEFLRSEDGYLVLDAVRHHVYAGEQLVCLTPTEFALLRQLMIHRGKVLTHRALVQGIGGPEYGKEADYVRVYLRQLRCKVEPDPSHPVYLITEPGVGYTFRSPPFLPARSTSSS